jgi:hypothetical protein
MGIPAICTIRVIKKCSDTVPLQPPSLQPVLRKQQKYSREQKEQRGFGGISRPVRRLPQILAVTPLHSSSEENSL